MSESISNWRPENARAILEGSGAIPIGHARYRGAPAIPLRDRASACTSCERLDALVEAVDQFLTDAAYTVSSGIEEELVAALDDVREALSRSSGGKPE